MSGDPQTRFSQNYPCGIVRWTSPGGETLVTLAEADFMTALVALYCADALETARICDEILDRRGALLGRVRDAIDAPGRAMGGARGA